MKKLFVSILALAAFAACQSDFNNDVNLGAPQGGSVVSQGEHTIYAEVGIGEETKATYGEGLVATWEENDQIALLQEHADYDKTFGVVNKLNIKEGWGTSLAKFNGDISVDATSPRVYHIAYPASAVSFSTSSSFSIDNLTYDDSAGTWGWDNWAASGSGRFTYTSTLNITVPTTQNGKWEPYMYASTSGAVASNGIGAKTLTTLTGAIAIRAFEADGVTPKQLKQITITSSDAAIAGAFSGTATSVGLTEAKTGERTGDKSNVLNSVDELKNTAYNNLVNVLKDLEPASTSVTKAMSLSFAGKDKSITATNLDAIASEDKGYYTYYVNVAPATIPAGTLTIVAVATDGSSLTRVVDKEVVIAASHRAGFNLKWESAVLKGGTIESWYDDLNKGSQFQLEGSTLYVDNISVEGDIAADNVLAIGVKINGTFHEASQQSGVMAISPIVISGLSSGVYKVQPVAKVSLNGVEKWLEGAEVTKTVTSIPTVTDYSVITSYSNNGNVKKDNEIAGDLLKVKANISDSYVANNLVNGKTYTICYGSNTATQALGEEWTKNVGYGALGQYVCYVKIQLANGYTVESQKFTTSITGIPYYIDPTSASPSGWTTSNTGSQDSRLLLKKSESYIVSNNLFYVPENCDVNVIVRTAAYHGWGSSTNNLYINPTASGVVKSGTAISVKGDQYYPDQAKWENKTQVCTLTASANEISIYANIPKSSGLQGFTGSIMIEDLWVQYK